MKTILFVALLTPISTSCVSPASPSEASGVNGGHGLSGVAIVSLAPATGNVGTHVLVRGSGFAAVDNTVSFAAIAVDGDMPNEPGVMPGLSSTDGTTIAFDVPALWRPACSFSPAPCPFARLPTAPGTYRVSVTNATGTSNAMTFLVSR